MINLYIGFRIFSSVEQYITLVDMSIIVLGQRDTQDLTTEKYPRLPFYANLQYLATSETILAPSVGRTYDSASLRSANFFFFLSHIDIHEVSP